MPDPSLEKQKLDFKKVGLKGAIIHFWTYYKWWAIIPIIVIVLAVYSITTYLKETKKAYLNIAMVNAYEDGMDLFNDYAASIGKEIVVDTTYRHPTNDDPVTMTQAQAASVQKLAASMRSGLTDVVITNSRALKEYTYTCFIDLRDVLTEEQMAKLKAQDLLYYLPDDDGNEIPVGIYISDMEFFAPAYPDFPEKHYLVLSGYSDRKKEEKLLLEYLFFQE
ncbi:MAG: hypothetical protein J6Y08_00410 [Clostridiales bacterium]|nr:hypothetical protein [Clostridiales bacterium]